MANEEELQSVLFEDEAPEPLSHKRRLLFKATASVPKRDRKRRIKKNTRINPDLLSS
jgi:hypothetical protein